MKNKLKLLLKKWKKEANEASKTMQECALKYDYAGAQKAQIKEQNILSCALDLEEILNK